MQPYAPDSAARQSVSCAIALAKAWRSWGRIDGNHEAYVRRVIVNEFAFPPRPAAGWAS